MWSKARENIWVVWARLTIKSQYQQKEMLCMNVSNKNMLKHTFARSALIVFISRISLPAKHVASHFTFSLRDVSHFPNNSHSSIFRLRALTKKKCRKFIFSANSAEVFCAIQVWVKVVFPVGQHWHWKAGWHFDSLRYIFHSHVIHASKFARKKLIKRQEERKFTNSKWRQNIIAIYGWINS